MQKTEFIKGNINAVDRICEELTYKKKKKNELRVSMHGDVKLKTMRPETSYSKRIQQYWKLFFVLFRFFNYPHTAPQHQGLPEPSLISAPPNFMPHHGHTLSPLLGLPQPHPPQHCQPLPSSLVTPHHGYQHPTNMGLAMHQPSSSQFSSTSSSVQGVPENSNGWWHKKLIF